MTISHVQATRPTSTMRHPLASASPLPDGLVMRQDTFSVLNYDPGDTYWPLMGQYCPLIGQYLFRNTSCLIIISYLKVLFVFQAGVMLALATTPRQYRREWTGECTLSEQ